MLSLVLATYGRRDEVELFCSKLSTQIVSRDLFELIIVDQNETNILNEIVAKYSDVLNIVHIKSDKKGLSYNRNIGIESARGSWLGFPDDDCCYYEDTISNLFDKINKSPESDCIMGQLYDRISNKSIIKKFPNKEKKISLGNFYSCVSSATLFVRINSGKFDERFGVGAKWGANEDADLIFHILKNRKGKVFYSPQIQVWHPDQVGHKQSVEKVYAYGFGFGAYARKNMCFPILLLLVKVLCYHGLKGLFIHKSRIAFSSRIKGFLSYEK